MQHVMPDANAGVTPQTATAEPTTVSPAAAPAAASSSTANQDIATRAKVAKSPLEVRQLIQELRANPLRQAQQPPKTPPAPAEAPAAEAATETPPADSQPSETPPAGAETPATEATPEGGETQPEGGEPAQTAPEGEPSDTGDDSIEAPTAKRMRVQLPDDDKVGRLAMAFMQRNRDWTLEQAMDAARNKLGIKPQQETAQPEATTPATPGLPATPQEVDAAIKQLRADRAKAQTDLRFEDVEAASNKIEDLLYHKVTLERQADQRAVQERSAYETTFQSSEKRAVELYPDAANAESEFGKRMIEIEQALEETADPLFHDPNKPLIIAQMAARDLRVPPRRKGAPATPAKPAAPVAPQPKKGVLPSGSSRTTAPLANQPPAIVQKAKAVRNIADLRAVYKELGIKM